MIDKTSTIVDLFLQRQHRLIPGSVEGGFSIFSSLLEIIKQNKTKFHEAVSILKEKKMGFEDFSLCNWICRNAYTGEFHQDSDSSYSLICVPFVNTSRSQSYLKMRGKYCFEFKWKECVDHSLKIDLDPGVSIYFLGAICDHKQYVAETGDFINLASYQNKRLYSAIKSSIIRILND